MGSVYTSHGYEILNDAMRTWEEAQAACQSTFGTDLASMHSIQDFDAMKTLCTTEGSNDCWIGFHRSASDSSVFAWSDGSTVDKVAPWYPNEPSNNGEGCAVIYQWDGRWNDEHCSNARPDAICNSPTAEYYEYPSCKPDCLQNRGGCPNNVPCHQLLDSVYRIEATGNCYLALTTCWGCLRDDTVVGVGTHLANVTCPFAPTAEPTPEPTSRPTTFEHYALPLMAQLVSGDTLNSFGWDGLSNVDKSTFNAFFAETCLVRRECPNCAEGHRVIYYKRIANDCDTFDAYDMLTHRWMSVDENGIGNVLNEDFLLTTNEAVARDINIQSWEQCDGQCWYKCNYVDDHDLVLGGFKECGPFIASSHNFYCESGPLCKSVRWSVL